LCRPEHDRPVDGQAGNKIIRVEDVVGEHLEMGGMQPSVSPDDSIAVTSQECYSDLPVPDRVGVAWTREKRIAEHYQITSRD
jgi:hypothetical protein